MAETWAYDAAAFTEKYDKYADMVFRICLMQLGDVCDAEDAMQNAFLKFCYKAPVFAAEQEEKAWLVRVTINTCRDFQRLFWRRNVIRMEDMSLLGGTIGAEQQATLLELYTLPPKYRTVLQLFYYEGYSVREIAEILHIKEKSVTAQLTRARQKLKMEMEATQHE